MFLYKIFRQLSDHTLIEIGQTTFLADAESILANWHSGMISDTTGEVLQTKNLTHDAEHALF